MHCIFGSYSSERGNCQKSGHTLAYPAAQHLAKAGYECGSACKKQWRTRTESLHSLGNSREFVCRIANLRQRARFGGNNGLGKRGKVAGKQREGRPVKRKQVLAAALAVIKKRCGS